MRIYLRQGDIVFSKQFVDTLREKGVILTRKDKFFRDGILINHGNSKPISLGKKVKEFYVLNKPSAIHMCSNKMDNYNELKEFYPETCRAVVDTNEFPVLAKPIGGHHGYGIKKFDNIESLSKFLKTTNEKYIIQRYIPIKHEFRFNVLDRTVFQVSHKQRLDEVTDKDGYVFSYRSLGNNARLSSNFWSFIKNVITNFHSAIGYDLADYCIDVMKGQDGEYYLSEINSAYGIGSYTLDKLLNTIDAKYMKGELEPYRVGTMK